MTLRTFTTKRFAVVAAAGVALVGFGVPTAVQAAETPTGLTNAQLTEMREEERMARDLYTLLAKSSGETIFTRIAVAEQRHMDAVERLMTSQGMDPDAAGDTVGRYAVADLQADYDRWLAQGKVSDEAAFKVGVELEKQDITGLKSLDVKDGTTGDRVVEALVNGSEHHLAAFTKAVNGDLTGVGPGMGRGMGRGMGPGAGPGMGAQQGRGGTGDPGSACPFGDDGQGPRGPAGRGTGQGRGAGWSS